MIFISIFLLTKRARVRLIVILRTVCSSVKARDGIRKQKESINRHYESVSLIVDFLNTEISFAGVADVSSVEDEPQGKASQRGRSFFLFSCSLCG